MSRMNPILRDLFAHQFWADTVLWDAIGAHAPARDDKAIRDRLHHIHQVQCAFVWGVRQDGTPFAFSKPEDFATFEDLRGYAAAAHAEVRRLLETITDARFDEPVSIPWFRDPPLTITI